MEVLVWVGILICLCHSAMFSGLNLAFFSLSQLQLALHSISGCPLSQFSNEAERLCGRVISQVLYTSAREIVEDGLHKFLTDINSIVEKIALQFSERYMFFPIVDPVEEAAEEPAQSQSQSVSA